MTSGSRGISKTIWGIRSQEMKIINNPTSWNLILPQFIHNQLLEPAFGRLEASYINPCMASHQPAHLPKHVLAPTCLSFYPFLSAELYTLHSQHKNCISLLPAVRYCTFLANLLANLPAICLPICPPTCLPSKGVFN